MPALNLQLQNDKKLASDREKIRQLSIKNELDQKKLVLQSNKDQAQLQLQAKSLGQEAAKNAQEASLVETQRMGVGLDNLTKKQSLINTQMDHDVPFMLDKRHYMPAGNKQAKRKPAGIGDFFKSFLPGGQDIQAGKPSPVSQPQQPNQPLPGIMKPATGPSDPGAGYEGRTFKEFNPRDIKIDITPDQQQTAVDLPSFDQAPQTPNFQRMPEPMADAAAHAEAVMAYDQLWQETRPEYAAARERMKIVRDTRQEGINRLTQKRLQLNDTYRELAANPPSVRSAVSGLGFFQMAGALAHSLLSTSGGLEKNGKLMINNMIERELESQKASYNAQSAYLKDTDTLYGKMIKILNDDYAASKATENVLLETMENELKFQQQAVKNQEESLKVQTTIDTLEQQRVINNNSINQQLFENDNDQFQHDISSRLKLAKLGGEASESKYPKLSDSLAVTKQAYNFGGSEFIVSDKKAIVNEANTSAGTIRDMNRVRSLLRNIHVAGYTRATAIPAVAYTEKAKTAQKHFTELNKILLGAMTRARIQYTGGGNMSDAERLLLQEIYEVVAPGKWDATKFGAMLKKKFTGRYDLIVKIMKKNAIHNMVERMRNDATRLYGRGAKGGKNFRDLSLKNQYELAARQFGISKKEMHKYITADTHFKTRKDLDKVWNRNA